MSGCARSRKSLRNFVSVIKGQREENMVQKGHKQLTKCYFKKMKTVNICIILPCPVALVLIFIPKACFAGKCF